MPLTDADFADRSTELSDLNGGTVTGAILTRAEVLDLEMWTAVRTGVMVNRCRGCGCTDERACAPPCWWVEPGLCSTCRGAES